MTVLNPLQILKKIPSEEFDYLLLSDILSEYSGVRQKINALLKNGMIIRIKKGLYILGPESQRRPVSKEILANLIFGPSCISLEYALAFYGLILERVENVTSITSKRDKKFITPVGIFFYKSISSKKFRVGLEQVALDNRHYILMASPEKALCDYLSFHSVDYLKTVADVTTFLEDDLRVTDDFYTKINLDDLRRVNRVYKLKSIDLIIDVLENKGIFI